MTQEQPSIQGAPATGLDIRRQSRRMLINLAIGVVVLIALSMVWVLFYYSTWTKPKIAQALFVVKGTEAHDGTVVKVEGADIEPITKTVMAKDNHICRFPLAPGTYSVRIETPGRRPSVIPQLEVREYQYSFVDLERLDAAAAGAR